MRAQFWMERLALIGFATLLYLGAASQWWLPRCLAG